jgi:hypothetical protein
LLIAPAACLLAASHDSLSLAYRFPPPPQQTARGLKNHWIGSLTLWMLQERLSEQLDVQRTTAPFLPGASTLVSIRTTKENARSASATLLAELKKVEKEGFSPEEFARAQAHWEHFLAAHGDQTSLTVLTHLSVADINQELDMYLSEESCEVSFPCLRTLLDNPLDPYNQLPLSHGEQKIIHHIVTTMAEKNLVKLLLEKKKLEKKGRQIQHVHPLRFIGYIFADSHLRHCMHKIRKSAFKWSGFIDGFAGRMDEEAACGNLDPYLFGFAQSLQLSPDVVQGYLHHHDWEGLVRFLTK